MKDLVYATAVNKTLNATADLPTAYVNGFDWSKLATLKTPLDDVFGWGPDNGPPVFYKFPVAFNTVRSHISFV